MNATRPAHMFVADDVSLDFLNALVHPAEKDGAIADGEDFMRWIEEAGLVPADTLESLRSKAVPGEIDLVAAEAEALGEWFRRFVEDYKGNPLPAAAIHRLQLLNRVLRRDSMAGKIEVRDTLNDRIGGSGLKWTGKRSYLSPDMLLLPIAHAMAGLICAEEFGNVRRCEGPGCALLFLDRTPDHARRWCSMAICGNRAEQAGRPST